jgi:hypothetical protein
MPNAMTTQAAISSGPRFNHFGQREEEPLICAPPRR